MHLEPMEEKLAVRYRIDDRLCDELFLPKLVHPPLVERCKKLQRPNLLTRLKLRKRYHVIWGEEQEHDLYLTFLPTQLGEKVVIKIIPAGWKSGWRRRRRRLSAFMAPTVALIRREVGYLAEFALDLLRLVVVLPSALLARLGLPFGRPLQYWRARYWGIDANLPGVQLSHQNLPGVNLVFANLEAADLSEACLRNAALRNANLARATLRGAILTGAIMENADLREADLREADLREAALSEANLQGAVLTDADLRGAYLSSWWWSRKGTGTGCDRGADLTGADLTGANLTGAHYDDSTRWPAGFDPQHHGAARVQ